MYASITEKVVGSTNTSERKILADDVNQIRQVIQTGEKDLKTNNISLLGNTITADNGANWIRRNGNTFQFYNGSSWQEPSTATLLTFTAGENISARDVVYLKVSDGKIYKASTANNDWIGVATAAISSGASGTIYPNGSLVGGFSGLTSGTWYGLNATAGTLTANENYIVGKAISATQIILIKPKGDMSTRDNALYKLQGEKAINDVSATNSGVLAGSSQVLIDKFLDSTGQNNTVDTGNTTAIYKSTNTYYDGQTLSTIILEPSFETVTNWTYSETNGEFDGGQSTNYPTEGTYSYFLGQNTAGTVPENSYCQILQSVNFDNINYLLFDYRVFHNGSVDSSWPARLKILVDSTEVYSFNFHGANEGQYNNNFVDLSSYSGTHNLIIRVVAPGADWNRTFGAYIDNLRTDYSFENSIIQSVATPIPTGMTKVFVTPLMYEALAAGDGITADVSIDNGAHYTTGIPINTWTPITSANGTQLIVKANLLTGDGSTSPKVSGWRVLLE